MYRNNNAGLGTAVAGDITSNSIAVTGTVEWYKGNATWGIAYKKHSATTWTYSASDSKSISMTLSSLAAATKYDICTYVKFNGEYQRGTVINKTTSAE